MQASFAKSLFPVAVASIGYIVPFLFPIAITVVVGAVGIVGVSTVAQSYSKSHSESKKFTINK